MGVDIWTASPPQMPGLIISVALWCSNSIKCFNFINLYSFIINRHDLKMLSRAQDLNPLEQWFSTGLALGPTISHGH